MEKFYRCLEARKPLLDITPGLTQGIQEALDNTNSSATAGMVNRG